jgi:hypothetical protein
MTAGVGAPGAAAALRRSWLVYLWAIASVAWALHSLQHVVRHGGVLFDLPAGAAVGLLTQTAWDVARPVLIAGAVAVVLALILHAVRSARR